VTTELLDEFASEQVGPVRLSDVLARGIPIRWDEAVALLQEIVETITAGGGDEPPMTAFEDVLVDEQGGVRVNAARRGERGPVAAGRALHTLLATADVPLPLRLFVTQANAPETHKTLKAFAEALAYFGKPGRADLIRAIYERHRSTAPPASTASAPGGPATPPPLAQKDARGDEFPEPRRTAPQWLIPAAVVVAIVSLAAVLWLVVLGGGQSGNTSVVAQAKEAIAVAKTTLQTASAQANISAQAALKTAGTQAEKPAPTARSRAQSASGKALPFDRVVSTTTPARPAARLVEESLTLSRPDPTTMSEANKAVVPVIPTSREYVVAPRENPTATIYSPSDVDVQPPVMIYPSLPPPMFIARNADAVVLNRMELVVAADGSVERVRLVNGPTRMPDMMLLSGAKMWKFSPAVKDGVPVRYRTTVTWTGFP